MALLFQGLRVLGSRAEGPKQDGACFEATRARRFG